MNLDLGDTRLIIQKCKEVGLLRNQVAYVLATAFHETAHTMKPVREYGGEKYLKKKRYYPYVGMGYVQLTWRANYQKASKKLGVDFVKYPKKLLIPEFAAEILVAGMVEGWFTGKTLSDYITLQKSDYKNARRIINGIDKRHLIASHAKSYEKALLKEGYGVEENKEQMELFEDTATDTVKSDVEVSTSDKVIGTAISAAILALLAWLGLS